MDYNTGQVNTSYMTKNIIRQAGVVAIFVTMIMMIVISLIVLGFAEISRTEQRNSLDDQLSVQAYYAAESGINDARSVIATDLATGKVIQSTSSCVNHPVSTTYDVFYTCLVVNATPPTLLYNIGNFSTVIPIINPATAFRTLTLDWKTASGSTDAGSCPTSIAPPVSFPPDTSSSWSCNFPVLRVDLLNANTATFSRSGPSGWSTDTATMFFVPIVNNASPNTGLLSDRGNILGADCSVTDCQATIDLGSNDYYMRVTTLYETNSKLTVSATVSAGKVSFYDAQATIDSTGKAQDVLRRVLVAVDLTDANDYQVPSGAIITKNSVCKQFEVTPGYFSASDPSDGGDPLCNTSTIGTPSP
jgi:Tfp pilus assembly protein PilX